MGRVAVEAGGEVVDEARFPGRQGRLLFAHLVAEQGRPVPRDELAEALWEDTPPPTWDKALTVLVSKVRALLTDLGVEGAASLTNAFGCYRLDLPQGTWVDVIVAAHAAHVAEGSLKADDLDTASVEATLAASLLAQPFLRGEDGAWVEAKRRELAGLHGRALDVLADVSLRSGDAPAAAKWAEQTIAFAPFRETGYRRLMEAHVAAGNRAEALQVYEQCRQLLAGELGTYPSPETESIYRELLEAPAPAANPRQAQPEPNGASPMDGQGEPAGTVRVAHPRVGGRNLMVVLACGAIVTTAVAAVVLLRRGSPESAVAGPVSADSVGVFRIGNSRPTGQIAVGASPSAVAAHDGLIWVANVDGHDVSLIDPVKQVSTDTIPVGAGPAGIAFGNRAIWVTNSQAGTVSRIDAATNTVVQVVDVGSGPVGIAYAAGLVWVANTGDNTVTRIDADTGAPAEPLPIAATEFAYGAGTLWASDTAANRVVRIDPATGKPAWSITVGNGPSAIAFGSGAAWVANSLDGTVSRIDPTTNSVAATIPVGNGPAGVAADAGGIWVTNEYGGTLVRIDPRTNQPGRPISVGNRPLGVAISNGSIVVSVRQSGAGHRGGTLTMRMNRPPDSLDPALAYDSTSIPFLSMTTDGLVGFNRASGVQGRQVVPDLAVSVPHPTDGGRSYTFRLRPNIRYSNGRLVKASDVRYTLERGFKLGPTTSYYDDIVGAAGCVRNPRRCDLSRGIVADDVSGTVTFNLVAPDSDFLFKAPMALVVPTGTPLREAGTGRRQPAPGTGPYEIMAYLPNRKLTLGRNPYFHEWSKAAQPDGYPERIVVEIGGTPDEAVRDVIAGKADAFTSAQSETPPSAARLASIKVQDASQVHTTAQPATIYLFLNTRIAPFDRLDVRRALNYAADRDAAVEALGGPEVAQTTCQIFPPYSPGYRPYCPYTAGTTTAGRWSAPDLVKARALIARSGTRGMKVTVWSWSDLPGLGPYTVKLLRSLGYRTSLRAQGNPRYSYLIGDSRTKAQIGTGEWISDFPAASGFFNGVLTCASFRPASRENTNTAEFCDPPVDRHVDQAVTEEATDPQAARRLWEQIDRQTVDQAPWVPLVNPKVVDVLSKRVGNYQFSPEGGMMIDQLWVR